MVDEINRRSGFFPDKYNHHVKRRVKNPAYPTDKNRGQAGGET